MNNDAKLRFIGKVKEVLGTEPLPSKDLFSATRALPSLTTVNRIFRNWKEFAHMYDATVGSKKEEAPEVAEPEVAEPKQEDAPEKTIAEKIAEAGGGKE